MNNLQLFVKNTISLSAARLVGMVGSTVFVVYAARHLGALGYGRYSFVIVFISYFSFLSEFGLDWVVVRDVATDKARLKVYMAGTVLLRGCASLLAMVLAWGSIIFLQKPELLPLVFIASGSLITSSLAGIFNSAFQAFERMEYVALIDVPYAVVRPALSIIVLACWGDLTALFLSQLTVDILRTLGVLAVYVTKIGKISVHWDGVLLKHLIKSASPLMLWRLLTLVEQRINFLLLAFFVGEIAVGWYAPPSRLIDMVGLLTLAAADALLPLLSRLFVDSRERFLAAAERVLRYIVIVFVPLALGISILARELVLWLFGAEYLNSVPVLQYLAWVMLLLTCSFLFGTMLLAMREWKAGAMLKLVAAVTAVASGLVLVPINQHVGAAQAFLLTEAVNTVVPLAYLVVRLKWSPTRMAGIGLVRLTALIAAIGAFLYIFRTVNQAILIPSSIAAYIVGVYFLGIVTQDEVNAVKQMLPWRLKRIEG